MGASKKVLAALVLTVLVLAGGVFGLRSWLGTDGTFTWRSVSRT